MRRKKYDFWIAVVVILLFSNLLITFLHCIFFWVKQNYLSIYISDTLFFHRNSPQRKWPQEKLLLFFLHSSILFQHLQFPVYYLHLQNSFTLMIDFSSGLPITPSSLIPPSCILLTKISPSIRIICLNYHKVLYFTHPETQHSTLFTVPLTQKLSYTF